VEFFFENTSIKTLLESDKMLTRKFGSDVATRIKKNLVLLLSLKNLQETTQFRSLACHELNRDRKGQFAINVGKGFRIIFVPHHNPPPVREDGKLNWLRIENIKFIEVTDYHD